jgi:hypothetical protein
MVALVVLAANVVYLAVEALHRWWVLRRPPWRRCGAPPSVAR